VHLWVGKDRIGQDRTGLCYKSLKIVALKLPYFSATSSQGQSGKACFVFVIDVQRIDITAQQDDAEDLVIKFERGLIPGNGMIF
jgi:hypothetical protein